jgi:hypothetical protein
MGERYKPLSTRLRRLLEHAVTTSHAVTRGSSDHGYSHCSARTHSISRAVRRLPHIHSCTTTSVIAARSSICSKSICFTRHEWPSSSHPVIVTAANERSGAPYSGAYVDSIELHTTITVPEDYQGSLNYYCQYHESMGFNALTIASPVSSEAQCAHGNAHIRGAAQRRVGHTLAHQNVRKQASLLPAPPVSRTPSSTLRARNVESKLLNELDSYVPYLRERQQVQPLG